MDRPGADDQLLLLSALRSGRREMGREGRGNEGGKRGGGVSL